MLASNRVDVSNRAGLNCSKGDWQPQNTTITSLSRSRAQRSCCRCRAWKHVVATASGPRDGRRGAAVTQHLTLYPLLLHYTEIKLVSVVRASVWSWCNHGVRVCHNMQMVLMVSCVQMCWEQLDRWRRSVLVPAAFKYENSTSFCVRTKGLKSGCDGAFFILQSSYSRKIQQKQRKTRDCHKQSTLVLRLCTNVCVFVRLLLFCSIVLQSTAVQSDSIALIQQLWC